MSAIGRFLSATAIAGAVAVAVVVSRSRETGVTGLSSDNAQSTQTRDLPSSKGSPSESTSLPTEGATTATEAWQHDLRKLMSGTDEECEEALQNLLKARARGPEVLRALRRLHGRVHESEETPGFLLGNLARLAMLQRTVESDMFVIKLMNEAREGWPWSSGDHFPFESIHDYYGTLQAEDPIMATLLRIVETRRERRIEFQQEGLIGLAVMACGDDGVRTRFRDMIFTATDPVSNYFGTGILALDPSLLRNVMKLTPFEKQKVVKMLDCMTVGAIRIALNRALEENSEAVLSLVAELLDHPDPAVVMSAARATRYQALQNALDSKPELSAKISRVGSK